MQAGVEQEFLHHKKIMLEFLFGLELMFNIMELCIKIFCYNKHLILMASDVMDRPMSWKPFKYQQTMIALATKDKS